MCPSLLDHYRWGINTFKLIINLNSDWANKPLPQSLFYFDSNKLYKSVIYIQLHGNNFDKLLGLI